MSTEMMDVQKFKMAVKMAMGLRTQKQFAEDIGTTPQYLSRLMTGSVRPTMDTLEKIATHSDNGITLDTLRKACGYNPKDNKSGAAEEHRREGKLSYEQANDVGYVVGLAAAQTKNTVMPSVEQYIEHVTNVIEDLEENRIAIFKGAIGGELVGQVKTDGQRKYQEADFTFRVPKFIARVKTVVSWMESAKDNSPHY